MVPVEDTASTEYQFQATESQDTHTTFLQSPILNVNRLQGDEIEIERALKESAARADLGRVHSVRKRYLARCTDALYVIIGFHEKGES